MLATGASLIVTEPSTVAELLLLMMMALLLTLPSVMLPVELTVISPPFAVVSAVVPAPVIVVCAEA